MPFFPLTVLRLRSGRCRSARGGAALAQEYRGTLHLTVVTENGKPVEEAAVTVTSVAASRTAETNAAGVVHFTRLEPGEYELEVLKAGYHTTVLTGIKVATIANVELKVGLQPAGFVERVVVTGETPLIDRREMGRTTSSAPRRSHKFPPRGIRGRSSAPSPAFSRTASTSAAMKVGTSRLLLPRGTTVATTPGSSTVSKSQTWLPGRGGTRRPTSISTALTRLASLQLAADRNS